MVSQSPETGETWLYPNLSQWFILDGIGFNLGTGNMLHAVRKAISTFSQELSKTDCWKKSCHRREWNGLAPSGKSFFWSPSNQRPTNFQSTIQLTLIFVWLNLESGKDIFPLNFFKEQSKNIENVQLVFVMLRYNANVYFSYVYVQCTCRWQIQKDLAEGWLYWVTRLLRGNLVP